jgi:hypothetical protein
MRSKTEVVESDEGSVAWQSLEVEAKSRSERYFTIKNATAADHCRVSLLLGEFFLEKKEILARRHRYH